MKTLTNNSETEQTQRRSFLKMIAGGAAALGLTSLVAPLTAVAQQKPMAVKAMPNATKATNDADAWFNKVKGSHRAVYDCTRPHEIMPFVWPKVFILTNAATGSPASDCGV